ncbi:hypothetical protein QYE76_003574 [Lolium multiflorum]|uniref:Uncharacterized protein n=1 Tax=Lolium multiflorum TaxID=4521 RepID=A0AAD8RQH2_LOLMU|nr:hypothetical protein QYE76_003574 [Lolium multiflorum]
MAVQLSFLCATAITREDFSVEKKEIKTSKKHALFRLFFIIEVFPFTLLGLRSRTFFQSITSLLLFICLSLFNSMRFENMFPCIPKIQQNSSTSNLDGHEDVQSCLPLSTRLNASRFESA